MNRNTFERYIQEFCEDLAQKQNNYPHKQKHAAVLTYENIIISSGVNVNLKNDFTKRFNDLKGLHAESVAIMRAIQKHYHIISKCELWICRRNNNKNNYSKPCPMCQKIIKTFNIKTIHYTINDGTWITENI